MDTSEHSYDDGLERTDAVEEKHRSGAVPVLMIVGYILEFPMLCTMFDNPIDRALNAWITGPVQLLILVGITVLGLICWIIAAVKSHRASTYGRAGGAGSLVRPIVTAITVMCALCIIFSLPLLCLAHMG